jgi:hypothetical protein
MIDNSPRPADLAKLDQVCASADSLMDDIGSDVAHVLRSGMDPAVASAVVACALIQVPKHQVSLGLARMLVATARDRIEADQR